MLYFAVANPCFKENISSIGVPDHFVLEETAPDIYQSGFYAHLICKREAGSDNYKRYNEAGETKIDLSIKLKNEDLNRREATIC